MKAEREKLLSRRAALVAELAIVAARIDRIFIRASLTHRNPRPPKK